ncbi:unnamed protein product, partial [Meganyctiphanes norvegica]
LKSLVKISIQLKYEDKFFWSNLHANLPSATKQLSNQCFISDSNDYPTVPTIMMSQSIRINNHYHNYNHYHQHNNLHQSQQPSIDFSDPEKSFISMETTQSSLAPSLNHSYMSIDYSQTRKNHIYDSVDDLLSSPPLINPPTPPLVHTLHQHIHQQQQQHTKHKTQHPHEKILLKTQQQYHQPELAEPAGNASY